VNTTEEAIGVDVDPPETRLLPRLIAGLAEVGCAVWLWRVWLDPEQSGLDGVLAAFAVVVLEGPLMACLVALFLFTSSLFNLKERAVGVVVFAVAALFAIKVATGVVGNVHGPNLYLLGMVAAIFVGKWMMFLDGRRNNFIWEAGKVFIQFITLVVCFGLATSFAPRLGFDAETVARLGVPERLTLVGGPPRLIDPGRDLGHPTWRVIAGGVFYFALYGVFRFVSLTRPARVRAAKRMRRQTGMQNSLIDS
jgi:hypothetical protein